jgi:hypothetical protein
MNILIITSSVAGMPGASSTNHSGWIRVLWSNMASMNNSTGFHMAFTRETVEKTLRFRHVLRKKIEKP